MLELIMMKRKQSSTDLKNRDLVDHANIDNEDTTQLLSNREKTRYDDLAEGGIDDKETNDETEKALAF